MIRIEQEEGHVEIWSEPEEGDIAVGRCIGSGPTLEDAKLTAVREIASDLRQLDSIDIQPLQPSGSDHFVAAAIHHGEPTLEFFSYAHLPEPLRFISKQFAALALDMVFRLPANLERAAMLRKLLECKDAAVRSKLSKLPQPQ